MGNPTQSLSLMLYAAAIIFGISGVLAFVAYRFHRGASLLSPPSPPRFVPWNGWSVAGAFVLVIVIPAMVLSILVQTRFFPSLYGADFPMSDGKSLPEKHAANLRGLWTQLFAIPFILFAVIVGTRQMHQTTSEHLGLTVTAFPRKYLLGWVGWVIAMPIVFGVFLITLLIYGKEPEPHPLTQLGDGLLGIEPLLLGIEVILLAPYMEELLFRGLLLPILVGPPSPLGVPFRGSDIVCGFALVFTLTTPRTDDFFKVRDWSKIADALAPMWFVLVMIVVYGLLSFVRLPKWLGSLTEVQAIFATSLFFATIHSNVWPSPIPLFVLALVLGWITLRSQSIIPAIVLHGLFNAVSATYLWLGGK